MPLDNDTKGWIMAAVSGIACTFGASIICVDLIVRQFPGKKGFKIQDSNIFLSTGLSLSFGVMIFSSLYSMLPSAKGYLIKGGKSPKKATVLLIVCFLGGAFGISVVSRILHKYIPHKVVDCDHEHGDEEEAKPEDEHVSHAHHHVLERQLDIASGDGANGDASHRSYGTAHENDDSRELIRRPSLHATISSKVTQLVHGTKKSCDSTGQCYGYSDACGTECFKNVHQGRPPRLLSSKSTGNLVSSRLSGSARTQPPHSPSERRPLLEHVNGTEPLISTRPRPATTKNAVHDQHPTNGHSMTLDGHASPHKHSRSSSTSSSHSSHSNAGPSDSHAHSHNMGASQHHHHVPTNVFFSIGMQTSLAIALHKVPEGFITYATNHANPTLGLSVFLALFIHNITEGFALALPLYLALNSRPKAMGWSALLGGVSQPLGAGVAALWLEIAGRGKGSGEGEPGDVLYGCMFAGTAGIMAMVSLQLLSESLDLTHSRRLCFVSAFAGMGILGLSSALTA